MVRTSTLLIALSIYVFGSGTHGFIASGLQPDTLVGFANVVVVAIISTAIFIKGANLHEVGQ